MIHLKTFKGLYKQDNKFLERLGIMDSMEEQVEEYKKIIKANPTKNKFKLDYKCDLGTYGFTLLIDPKIDSEGYFNNRRKMSKFTICLKNRNDDATLLHEVKHLDFNLRKRGRVKNDFTKAQTAASVITNSEETKFGRSVAVLKHIFYIYEENEFQAKYYSFYKNFDIFLSEQSNLTSDKIRDLFFNKYSDWVDDTTFSWYVVPDNYEFKFRKFINEKDLYTIFSYVIAENKRKTFKNPYLDVLSYLVSSIKNDFKLKFKIFFSSDKQRLDKAIIFFENEINRRLPKYKRKMTRIVTLMCEKYIK